jgi:hypothetical protein
MTGNDGTSAGRPVDDSDLWRGDEERDWRGHEMDCCPSTRENDPDRWLETCLRVLRNEVREGSQGRSV